MKNIEFTDRYTALGIEYPNIDTICSGQCEGTGVIPVFIRQKIDGDWDDNNVRVYLDSEEDQELVNLWLEAEKENPSNDGWHFVKCPSCNGTGKGV